MRLSLLLFLAILCLRPLSAQFSFTDQTGALNLTTVTSGAAMGIADMNGDGLDDLIRLDDASRLYIEYQQAGSAFSLLDYGQLFGTQWSLCIADVDDNGFNDILTGGSYNNLKLLRANADGTAYNQTLLAFPPIFLQGSNFADIDNDGDADLFACHDDGLSAPFRNDGNGNLTVDYSLINTASTVPSDNSGNYGSVWTDYDNDGDLDLYISKCRLGVTNPNDGRRRNLLFRNNGDGTFTDVAEAAGLLPLGQSWATEFGDIDNDGDLDAFIINHDIPSKLYLNNSFGQFTEVTAAAGIADALAAAGPGIQVLFEDFDNDGWLDILYTSTGGNHCLFRNNGDLTFTNLATAFPTQGQRIHSATTGDLDDDGFIDVYAGFANSYNTPSNIPDKLFLNNGNDNNYLKVRLEGAPSNPNGIGARLTLYGDWGIMIREVRSGESYGIMRSLTRHFGLGQSNTIDSLVVRWPAGTIDRIPNPAVNQTLVLQEGANCAGAPAFSAAVTDLTVDFSDLSSTGPTQWLWDFGDGAAGTQQNPQHTYNEPGIYTVCLQTSGACPTTQVCQSVNVSCTPPLASFGYQGTGLTVTFADSTINFPADWLWDFGDGTTSTEQHPQHTYDAPGDYQVCLTAASDCGQTQICADVTVVCAPPAVGFTANIFQLAVSFTDNSSPSVSQWLWDFGDGATSTDPNPQHTYTAPGEYEVCLTISDVCGSSEICQTFNLTCLPPAAGFSLQGINLDVSFTDLSQGTPSSWLWEFGDGATATQQNPQHTYAAPGVYTICLTAASVCGSTQVCQDVTITCAPPAAGFGYQTNQLVVDFVDGSANNPTQWLWDFGDGGASTEQNPQHIFDAPGTYQVCLTVSGVCGATQVCDDVTVSCAPPLVGFSLQTQGLQVSFVDASDNSVTGWLWDFGDGNTSTEENPVHTYAAPGSYTVCLEVSDNCGANEVCLNFNVSCATPIAGFSSQADNLTVSFADNSLNGPAAWLWDFGDGNTSAEADPQHTYVQPGDFQVCLTVNSACGSSQVCEDISVTCAPPQADFASLLNQLTVTFTDNSDGSPAQWQWDFGDGNTSAAENPQHTYDAPGFYEVCLEVTSICGSNQRCKNISVICAAPQAGFTFQSDELQVSFSDNSFNTPASWSWDFGDGTSADAQNPTHLYGAPGDYEVCLTAASVCGSNQVCETITVTCAPPQAAFSSQSDGLSVFFQDNSTQVPGSRQWDFGDGGTSSEENPQHTYAAPGDYQVCLTVASVCGEDQTCETITVTCAAPQAAFAVSAQELTLSLADQSTGGATQWAWTFGDGNQSAEENPQHTYAGPGDYQVCLTASSVCGQTQSCETITVTCAAPQAGFTVQNNGLMVTFSDNSSGVIDQWNWTFGNGASAQGEAVAHTYDSPGNYTVCVNVSGVCGVDQFCQTITVNCAPPQAAFTTQADQLMVSFTDQSTNGAGQWVWTFGDGGTSNQPNPQHTYLSPGTYQVCLTVAGECGATQSCQTIEVTCAPPQAGFSFVADQLTYTFTDQSTNGPVQWFWDFGDGGTSSQADPGHTFAAPGIYTICLVVSSVCGTTQSCQTVAVTCSAPQANFDFSLDELTVSFEDLSTFSPTSWNWDFGDGTTSDEQNPQHTYAAPGNYTICLVAESVCGSTERCETLTVNCSPPLAGFSASSGSLTVAFSDDSGGTPAEWLWDFGDGATSTEQHPEHTYAAPGDYQVCLQVGSICGTNQSCQTVSVTCAPPMAFYSISVNGFTQIFIDLTTGSPTAWLWTFGDGGSSTQQNPQHDYSEPGIYEVCLVVENICGTDTLCQTIMVDVVSTGSPGATPVLFEIFPNPAPDQLRVRTGGASDDHARLRLLTVQGDRLAEYAWPVSTTAQVRMLDLSPYPAGLYLLELWVEGKRKVQKVVKSF